SDMELKDGETFRFSPCGYYYDVLRAGNLITIFNKMTGGVEVRDVKPKTPYLDKLHKEIMDKWKEEAERLNDELMKHPLTKEECYPLSSGLWSNNNYNSVPLMVDFDTDSISSSRGKNNFYSSARDWGIDLANVNSDSLTIHLQHELALAKQPETLKIKKKPKLIDKKLF
ncbi:MAG: hypothetical protein WD512_14210, partial [Candidatus Paceibacterota bacterium]